MSEEGLVYEQRVTEDQPWRYGDASGDTNPIHTDPEFARSVGLDGVILQGLCTMAFCFQAVTAWAGGDPTRVEALEARFTEPVHPGETVRFEGEIVDEADSTVRIRIEARTEAGRVLAAEATVADSGP